LIDLRPILMTIGVLLIVLAAGMLIPSVVDLIEGNPDWQVFATSAAITAFAGSCLGLTNRGARSRLSIQQAFLMTSLVWVVLTFFGAVPFIFSALHLSFTDAYFESMSGITTTGSTVITDLDHLAPGLLLWRAILQWLGGLGIIVVAMSFLPMLRIGGMQMFKVEAFETEGKMLATAAALSARISIVMVTFTMLLILSLWACGMTVLEATVHAMTTIATGGYSTSDASVGHFDSPAIDGIITVGMVAGGIPFVFYVKLLHGNARTLVRDTQVRWYLLILIVVTLAIAAWLWSHGDFSAGSALRYASFNVVSIMTGTGYASADYELWGTFPAGVFFFLMFVGGCYGSTACGIKIFRFQILFSATVAHIRRLVQPHGIFTPKFNHNPITDDVINSVLGYFMIFGATFVAITVGLTLLGLDLVTATSGAGTALSNVGPGLGPIIGPAGNFQSLPDTAKWLLVVGMLIGRLEVFTIFVLFNPGFWRG
jgi:trk system potassium uptake protein TrkH